jgi:lysyl-tRNA synthetase, class II
MEELSELLLQRRKKVDALWEAGINPYPNDFRPVHTSKDVSDAYGHLENIPENDRTFVVAGRIIARRSFGKAAFIQMQDRKGRVQLYVKKDAVGEVVFADFQTFDIGDIVGAFGYPFRTKTGELSLHVKADPASYQVSSAAAREIPRPHRCGNPLPATLCGPDRQPRGARRLSLCAPGSSI